MLLAQQQNATLQIPRDKSIESTFAFLKDPYRFIQKRCQRYGTDVFQARLMLQSTICMSGPDAAELFFDVSGFQRRGAAPGAMEKTLLGKGGVQELDDEEHEQRKKLFVDIMSPENVKALVDIVGATWGASIPRWAARNEIVFYNELHEILTRAVCAWADVPLQETEVPARKRQLTALFDHADPKRLGHWWARLLRGKAERWGADIVRRIRAGELAAKPGSAVAKIAGFYQRDGALLPPEIAAVELLNVLRPVVATSVFLTFVAHALAQYPAVRERIDGTDETADQFVQEVRRFYPFFPVLTALVRRTFDFHGFEFPEGTRTMLDVYGTNHDPRAWQAPEEFKPERFHDRVLDGFIPQGGGDLLTNHRCPGEHATIELMKLALSMLTRHMSYELPVQDLTVDFGRLPALPGSRMILRRVRETK
jgi:fatty-acid peroxygenase